MSSSFSFTVSTSDPGYNNTSIYDPFGGSVPAGSSGSGSSGASYANSAQAAADIGALYQSVLGRAVDPNGLAASQAYLASGASLGALRTAVAYGAEAQNDLNRIFKQILGRPLDANGLAAAQSYLANGGSMASYRTSVAGSPEAIQDLQNVFQGILGRLLDANGLAAAQSYLVNGGSMASYRTSVAGSPEAIQDLQNVFQGILGRLLDANGLAADRAYLAAGGTMAAYRTSVAGSPEAIQDLQNVFQGILGRLLDANGLAADQSYLAAGGTMAAYRSSVAGSAESVQNIQSIYMGALGRAASATDISTNESYLGAGNETLAQVRIQVATSAEAQAGLNRISNNVDGFSFAPSQLASAENSLAVGQTLVTTQTGLAHAAQSSTNIDLIYIFADQSLPSIPELQAAIANVAAGQTITSEASAVIGAGGGSGAQTTMAFLDDSGTPMLNYLGQSIVRTATVLDPHRIIDVGFSVNAVAPSGSATAVGFGFDYASSIISFSNLLNFVHGGAWDAQRVTGSFQAPLTDYANELIGMYAKAAGIPLDGSLGVLGITNTYAALRSNFSGATMDSTYTSLSLQDAQDVRIGYNSVLPNGTIHYHGP